MNIETVNELIQSLESAGELSIKERKYLDVMRWAIRVAGERDAALNAERVWEKTMMEACGEDGPGSVANEIRSLRALRDTALTELRAQVEQLAAENVQARERHSFIRALAISILEHSGGRHDWRGAMEDASDLVKTVDEVYSNTPATDRIAAGLRSAFVDEAVAKIAESGALTIGDCIVAVCSMRGEAA